MIPLGKSMGRTVRNAPLVIPLSPCSSLISAFDNILLLPLELWIVLPFPPLLLLLSLQESSIQASGPSSEILSICSSVSWFLSPANPSWC